ncbi:MAG: hypothetical protein AB1847_00915 [bacterium]
MERQQRAFLKAIRKNLIYPFFFSLMIVCLALSPERSAAQFYPIPIGGFGAPFGSPLGIGLGIGGFAPGISLPLVGSPLSLAMPPVLPGLGWQSPTAGFVQASPLLTQASFGSPYGSFGAAYGSGMPISYGQSAYNPYAAGMPVTNMPMNYGQPVYSPYSAAGMPMVSTPMNYGQPINYGQPTYNPYAPSTGIPVNYPLDSRSAQSYTNPQYYPGTTYTGQTQTTTSQQPTTSSTSSSSDTAIQNLPNLSALWQGSYKLYDPASDSLEVATEGEVTLGLTQKKNEYQINGYMTVTNWEIADQTKRGRVLATATYSDISTIDSISVIVKFYPNLSNDQEPDSSSVQYVWIISGSIRNDMLQGSLNISGPDYSKAGTITLARKLN